MTINNDPTMTISIRKAIDRDLPDIERITAKAYHKYIAIMGQKSAPMVADYSAHLTHDMVFVAEDIGPQSVVGYAIITIKDGHYWLETIDVAPTASGRGIGSQLIAFVEGYIATRASDYQLYTNVKMTENINWYLRIGFQEVKRQIVDGYERIYFKKALN
jgi:ribosomal protein S18 acetylase RimI-like enzyme